MPSNDPDVVETNVLRKVVKILPLGVFERE